MVPDSILTIFHKLLKENNVLHSMGKITVFNAMTVDGLFEGNNHDLSWHNVDEEFNEFAIDQLKQIEALLFGSTTYNMMAQYWQSQEAIQTDPIVAEVMNSKKKYLVSTSTESIDWTNTTTINKDIIKNIEQLKNESKGDIFIFGSAMLADSLLKAKLIDEIRILVTPIILGEGTPLFKNFSSPIKLKLSNSKTFKNGNVVLIYQVQKN